MPAASSKAAPRRPLRSPARPPLPKEKAKVELPIGSSLPIGASPKDMFLSMQKLNDLKELPSKPILIQKGSIVSVLSLSIHMKATMINSATKMAKLGLPCLVSEASQLQHETAGMWIAIDKLVLL